MREGFTLDGIQREALHEKIGRDLPFQVYEQQITGNRILVAPEPVSEKTGVLYKPRGTIEREKMQMGAGWVVSVGPLVGGGSAPHPVGVLCDHPRDLLGKRVLYKAYTGVSLRLEENEDEFGGSLVVMTDRDVLAVSEGL